jgi:ubiquinone biosynthesis protein
MAELGKLQDRIEPFSTPEARRIVEKELGQPIDQLFSEFSAEPIGAASLAQVWAVVAAGGFGTAMCRRERGGACC